jgi:ABC-2 type transport system ATP-binding protein
MPSTARISTPEFRQGTSRGVDSGVVATGPAQFSVRCGRCATGMSAPSAIETFGLGRDFGSTCALDALDLVVTPGARVGLLGPNGAGKTTAMLVLATLLKPSRGSARVFGCDIVRERASTRRRLGLVFQEASLDGLLTVRENLLFAAGLMGLGRAAARQAVADAIERTGLEACASQSVRRLSGGWRRLTDIARATVHRPDLLILDEPTVGLDPEHRDQMWALLDTEHRASGTTVLFSTHYLAEAESCDHVVLLAHGRVVAAGSPDTLKRAVGQEIVELEGSGAERTAHLLQTVATPYFLIRTPRGYRIGISGPHEELARIVGAAACITRFAIRPATLEDVYFARTQGSSVPTADGTPGAKAL